MEHYKRHFRGEENSNHNNYTDKTAGSMQIYNVESLGKINMSLLHSSNTFNSM